MKRVSLRPIRLTDLEHFLRWWNDPVLRKLTSQTNGIVTPRTAARRVVNMINPSHDLHRMILLYGKPIGHIALVRRRGAWHELQIVIGEKQYWNKGYGSKAMRAILTSARHSGVKKTYLEVLPSNRRARRAFARCGFLSVRSVPHRIRRGVPTMRMEYAQPRSQIA